MVEQLKDLLAEILCIAVAVTDDGHVYFTHVTQCDTLTVAYFRTSIRRNNYRSGSGTVVGFTTLLRVIFIICCTTSLLV